MCDNNELKHLIFWNGGGSIYIAPCFPVIIFFTVALQLCVWACSLATRVYMLFGHAYI
jgi:hypothetical protein